MLFNSAKTKHFLVAWFVGILLFAGLNSAGRFTSKIKIVLETCFIVFNNCTYLNLSSQLLDPIKIFKLFCYCGSYWLSTVLRHSSKTFSFSSTTNMIFEVMH